MVETKFHLLEEQMKVFPVDTIVSAKFGFGETPKVLNAIDVAFLPARKLLPVINAIVLVAVSNEPVVRGKGVRINCRSLRYFLRDDEAENGTGNVWDWTRIYMPVSLQNTEYNDLSSCSSATVSFSVTSKV